MEKQLRKLLETELTPIPELIRNYGFKNYNNGIGNLVLWSMVFWFLLHSISNHILYQLFRTARYTKYACLRIIESFWIILALTCCVTSSLANFFTAITFYMHSALWGVFSYQNPMEITCNAVTSALFTAFYITGRYDQFSPLCRYLTITRLSLEFTKLISIFLFYKTVQYTVLIINSFIFISAFVMWLPFKLPLQLVIENSRESYLVLLVCSIWILLELLNSVLFLWFWNSIKSDSDSLETPLFPPRNDSLFHLLTLRREMKQRHEKALSMRKPKNKNVMMIQTLKCMMTLKKKLLARRDDISNETKDIDSSSTEDECLSDETGDDVCNGKLQFNIKNGVES